MVKGGSERVISVLANYFCKTHNVKIITLLDEKIEYQLNKSIEVVNLYKNDSNRLIKIPGWIYLLGKQFKKLKDSDTVVISFVARINLVTLIANIFTRLPVIISERNDPERDSRGLLTKILVQVIYPKAHKIIFQSNYAMGLFSESIRKKGMVIHNPISVPDVKMRKTRKKVVVNIGRLSPQKNQSLLLKAFSHVAITHPDYSLKIYGEGPLRNNLEDLAECLGIADKVEFDGVSNNIHKKILNCSMFVLSSDYEGQSNALLEAMALGIPCISTDIPGHREILDDSNSITVEPKNEKQLAEAMSYLMDNPEHAKSLGDKAHLKMNELSGTNILSIWGKIVRSSYEQ